MKPDRGVLILVFGILGLVFCQFFGIAAWVMGNNDLQEMSRGWMDPTGRDMTQAGRICGIIATVIFTLQLFLMSLIGLAMLLSN